ncbi:MAG: hypothetical protein RLZZ299_1816 [Pseudomonadota bacterium]
MRMRMGVMAVGCALWSGCADAETPKETNAEEVITSVRLVFEPQDGGGSVEAWWRDTEVLGAAAGDARRDPVPLTAGGAYLLRVSFLNELEEPAEDISEEVRAEAEEHQVFLTGSAVQGPATPASADAPLVHTYADVDAGGLPLGLENGIVVRGSGAGSLHVTLRHLPVLGDAPSKVEGLAERVAAEGMAAIPGESDVDVSFDVSVP